MAAETRAARQNLNLPTSCSRNGSSRGEGDASCRFDFCLTSRVNGSDRAHTYQAVAIAVGRGRLEGG